MSEVVDLGLLGKELESRVESLEEKVEQYENHLRVELMQSRSAIEEITTKMGQQKATYEASMKDLVGDKETLGQRLSDLEGERNRLQSEVELLSQQIKGFAGLRDALKSLFVEEVLSAVKDAVKQIAAEMPVSAPPGSMVVGSSVSDITVGVIRQPLKVQEDTLEGQIAILVSDGYFGKERRTNHVTAELSRTWRKVDWHQVEKVLNEFCLPPFCILSRTEHPSGGWFYRKRVGPRAGSVSA